MPVWWFIFANEVPEIEDEIVRIVAVAREANPPSRFVGPRTKIAVDTLDRDVGRWSLYWGRDRGFKWW